MSDDEFEYQVKFTDIRASTAKKRRGGYRTGLQDPDPIPEDVPGCEAEGCSAPGLHTAPRRNGVGKHYFCQRHAGEYNRAFNFFENMSEAEIAAFNEQARSGFKRTWRFGTGPMAGKKAAAAHDPRNWAGRGFFDTDDVNAAERRVTRGRSRLQIKALTELDLDEDASVAQIRTRYGEYVRRFHPDSNAGDRSSEEKLSKVIKAGKVLKSAGLMK